ncbi:MAG: hydrogenase maturation protease [Verrucomicrobiae bacterium]|nr:hydrogenase maturation protease [Verrucomicrobiae bacterium]
MSELREMAEGWLRGRACFVGVGNADRGDDGIGVRLAEALRDGLGAEVVLAGDAPERCLTSLVGGDHGAVVFLDAVDFGGEVGSVAVFGAPEIVARFPQVSTHGLSLGTLARLIEGEGGKRAWMLGVQPGSLEAGSGLSAAVRRTLDLLAGLFHAAAGTMAEGVRS